MQLRPLTSIKRRRAGIVRRIAFGSLTILFATFSSLAVSADTSTAKPTPTSWLRPQDELWMVSTRHLGCQSCSPTTELDLNLLLLDGSCNQWRKSSLAEYLDPAAAARMTSIYVHGNWTSFDESSQMGASYYQYQILHRKTDAPVRVVIWSWPSTRDGRALQDVRAKYAQTDWEGQYLAWFLSKLSREAPVSLTGFSFGAPIVTGALHHMATAERLTPELIAVESPRRYQAVLMAAAEDCCALSLGGEHRMAPEIVERLLILKNGCDPLLKRFRMVDKCARPDALGYCGLCGSLGINSHKAQQIEVSGIVGKEHAWYLYVTSPTIAQMISPYVWFDEHSPAPSQVASAD